MLIKMSTSCVLHPRLSNGEKSPLFSRLKNFLGDRKSAEEVYYRAINPDFKKVFPNVRIGDDGTPSMCPSDLGLEQEVFCTYNCQKCWNRPYEEFRSENIDE